jgi:hypothetical protein
MRSHSVGSRIATAGRIPARMGSARSACALFFCVCFVWSFLAAPGVGAQECESSTVARKLAIEKSRIRYETLDEKRGSYVATLKNGDLVMAWFSPCGLGLHAHFYSRTPITEEQKGATLRWFLAAVLPNAAASASLGKQIDAPSTSVDKKTYTFTGANDESHTFEFKASESPLYRSVLHYRWNPPLH